MHLNGVVLTQCVDRSNNRRDAHQYKNVSVILRANYRAPDKDSFLFSRMPISSPNPMFDHLLESSHRDDFNKWSNIGFG